MFTVKNQSISSNTVDRQAHTNNRYASWYVRDQFWIRNDKRLMDNCARTLIVNDLPQSHPRRFRHDPQAFANGHGHLSLNITETHRVINSLFTFYQT